jgi:nicotinamidase-related amidase
MLQPRFSITDKGAPHSRDRDREILMPKTGLGGLLRPNVFIVTDASGGASVEAHDMGVQRMQAAGAIPITWVAVAAEWQRDRAHEKTVDGFANILLKHGGTSSIAFAWEPQLLAGHNSRESR